MLPDCGLQVPITKDRPSEAKYFVPPADARDRFTAGAMPAIAYLDTGIYCHPIVDGLVDAVKIGYYNPPDMPRRATTIDSHRELRRAVHARAEGRGRPRRRGRRPMRLRPRRRRRLRARPDTGPRPTRSSGSDGGAPATSSPRGWGGCSPSSRCRAAPSTTSPASPQPDSNKGTPPMPRPSQRTLQQRLSEGVVLGAEGYVFELERRGYIQAGPFVPEVILDEPDALRQLHREFLRAGLRRDGRVDLLRPPRQVARRRARRRPRGDEPPGGEDRQRDRRRGRGARRRQHLQHLGL